MLHKTWRNGASFLYVDNGCRPNACIAQLKLSSGQLRFSWGILPAKQLQDKPGLTVQWFCKPIVDAKWKLSLSSNKLFRLLAKLI